VPADRLATLPCNFGLNSEGLVLLVKPPSIPDGDFVLSRETQQVRRVTAWCRSAP
jgi:hypothetical protein